MPLSAFIAALCLLLIVPGPTNAVLAMAGAERGLKRALPLAAVVLAGYLSTVLPVLFLAAPVLEAWPHLADLVKLVAAAWVLWLAARLWVSGQAGTGPSRISPLSLYGTTVLNPKGLVIGLALLPSVQPVFGLALPLALLGLAVLAISSAWLCLGATAIRAISLRHPVLVARLASGCLGLFGAGLAARAVGLV